MWPQVAPEAPCGPELSLWFHVPLWRLVAFEMPLWLHMVPGCPCFARAAMMPVNQRGIIKCMTAFGRLIEHWPVCVYHHQTVPHQWTYHAHKWKAFYSD